MSQKALLLSDTNHSAQLLRTIYLRFESEGVYRHRSTPHQCDKKVGIATIIDPNKELPDVDPRIVTTERELEVFERCKIKLAHLSNQTVEYDHLNEINFKDYVGKFSIYYRNIRVGRLMDFYEGNNGPEKFIFPCVSKHFAKAF